MSELQNIAKQLIANQKGIFAADASPETLKKRMAELGMAVESEEKRREYRELLFTTRGLGKYIGGIIMHDESIRQRTGDGISFVEIIKKEGILPGIKVDRGTVDMPFFSKEKTTEGLDGLRQRLSEYKKLGAEFTKWRAVIQIGEGMPSRMAMVINSQLIARYAAFSQEAGMVPIVEPEVIMEGTHSIEKCAEVTEAMGRMLLEMMTDFKVDLGAVLYKTNMVIPGKEAMVQGNDQEVAEKTVELFKKIISVQVPGVVFLSGGQDPIGATRKLNLINQLGAGVPWRWSFSYERALEGVAMKLWQGKKENFDSAQRGLLHRAEMNSLASVGKYKEEMEMSYEI